MISCFKAMASPVSVYPDRTPDIPKKFELKQNFTNPINPSTVIILDIPENLGIKLPVGLSVYDIRGKCERTLIDSDLGPGNHTFHCNGRNAQCDQFPSGIYLYTLLGGDETYTRKMTILN